MEGFIIPVPLDKLISISKGCKLPLFFTTMFAKESIKFFPQNQD
jgi:hypothetical protein